MEIKKIIQSEKADAMQLVWSVFLEYEAPEYADAAINTFREFINSEEAISRLEIYGAYEGRTIVGIIATRNVGNHIALFLLMENIIDKESEENYLKSF